MPLTTPPVEQPDLRTVRECYERFGLEPGASMREVETAYWRFARELRGQAAMAAYNEAYEVLASRSSPQAYDLRDSPPARLAKAKKQITLVASPSKFGWPAN